MLSELINRLYKILRRKNFQEIIDRSDPSYTIVSNSSTDIESQYIRTLDSEWSPSVQRAEQERLLGIKPRRFDEKPDCTIPPNHQRWIEVKDAVEVLEKKIIEIDNKRSLLKPRIWNNHGEQKHNLKRQRAGANSDLTSLGHKLDRLTRYLKQNHPDYEGLQLHDFQNWN
jgi:hypothetical protein